MSKRKYAKEVSEIRYTVLYKGEICFWTQCAEEERTPEWKYVPVRIVRESFYRRLLDAYETLEVPEDHE